MTAISALDFSGRRVLVTGGARGIGKAIALKFVELNATVFVLDKYEHHLEALAKKHPKIKTVVVDLRDWEATRQAVESVLPIHHLANNAGIAPTKAFLDVDLSHIDEICDVNFKAALHVAQLVAKGMIEHKIKNGTIVSTSSLGDTITYAKSGVYCAFKAALTMLTKSMAVELAEHGIRVNCVRPGVVNTELAASLPKEYREMAFGPVLQRMLFHEPNEPEEIADAFVFLSSTLATKITGTALSVDQGYSIQ